MATQLRQRTATPERWQHALKRAIAGNVQVRQLGSTGQWIATSASNPGAAYEMRVTGDIAHGCTCHAGEFGDPVCCHRAAFYHRIGLLDLASEPAAETVACQTCDGAGEWRMQTGGRLADYWTGTCRACDGAGTVGVQIIAA